MYGTAIPRNGTTQQGNGTGSLKRDGAPPFMDSHATDHILEGQPPSCRTCGGTKICARDGEICCTACGTVLGTDYQPEHEAPASRLNLYQATEVGTARVALDCARHMHDAHPEKSLFSNTCTKLQLPMHASREAASIYHKVVRQRRMAKLRHALLLKHLAARAMAGDKDRQELDALRASTPNGCTRAHTAAFAIHTVCRRLGLPRTEDEILQAVRMNFGIKRNFTMLKAYSLNESTAREAGIKCEYERDSYYVRLIMSQMRDRIGTGRLFDRVMQDAMMNLRYIEGNRDNARAARAVSLALRGIRLHVPV